MIRVLLVGFLLAMVAVGAHAASLTGTARVIDGDTIEVAGQRVRLAGIDAPERDQPYGQESSDRLAQMVEGEEVRVDWYKKDRWCRSVEQIWVQVLECLRLASMTDVNHVTLGGMANGAAPGI